MRVGVNHAFLAYMVAVGVAAGVVQIVWPETRSYRLPPYFWVLIATALFEGVNFLRARGTPGAVIGMDVRLAGFVLGIVLMITLPLLAQQVAKP